MDPLAFGEQLREMAVVGILVSGAHELHHPLREVLGQGVPGTSAPVAVDECGRAGASVAGKQAEHLAFRDAEQTCDLGYREATRQVLVEEASSALLAGPEVDRGIVHGRTESRTTSGMTFSQPINNTPTTIDD
jgi:hypothetical protein